MVGKGKRKQKTQMCHMKFSTIMFHSRKKMLRFILKTTTTTTKKTEQSRGLEIIEGIVLSLNTQREVYLIKSPLPVESIFLLLFPSDIRFNSDSKQHKTLLNYVQTCPALISSWSALFCAQCTNECILLYPMHLILIVNRSFL